jgi:hypothetical protein
VVQLNRPAELFGGKPRVPRDRHQLISKSIDRLMDATPAQLKRIARVVEGLLDE